MTIGELLAMKYSLHERKDELSADLSAVNKSIADVDEALMKQLRDSGQTKASDDRVTVSITDKMRAKYDPDHRFVSYLTPAEVETAAKAGG